jgi:hypothetical protein
MLPKSVSPRFVLFAPIPLGIPPLITILMVMPLSFVRAVTKLFNLDNGLFFGIICGAVYLLSYFLVRVSLWSLGIPVRRQSVERFQAAHREDEDAAVDLPIQIRHSQRLIWVTSALVFLIGFVVFQMPFCFPQAVQDTAPSVIFGTVFMMIGLMLTRWKPAAICEITEKGIRAPAGFWDRLRFVPWEELVRCEIIHDDVYGNCDHFQLWDRAGRCRIDASSWIGKASGVDRARILRALRLRFPAKAKAESHAEPPALLPSASSALWDRQLDG